MRMIERSGTETEERRVRRDHSYRNRRERERERERDVHGDTEDERGTLIDTHYEPISAHCFPAGSLSCRARCAGGGGAGSSGSAAGAVLDAPFAPRRDSA